MNLQMMIRKHTYQKGDRIQLEYNAKPVQAKEYKSPKSRDTA